MSRLVSWGAHLAQVVEPATSTHFIPEATWKGVIAPEVMRQCDALDGVRFRACEELWRRALMSE